MHGFFGSYSNSYEWDLSAFTIEQYIIRKYNEARLHLIQATLPKFIDDKYFYSEDGCFLAIEGVLFVADAPSQAIKKYKKGEIEFWKEWRGSFAGIFYDAREDILLIFNDHIGSKMLFYAQEGKDILFASDLSILTNALSKKHARLLNESFAWHMLTFGYSPTAETPVSGVKRILAGQYIYICKNNLQVQTYHRFHNTKNKLSVTDNIRQTNALFEQAVQRVLDKNDQYSLRHVAALSAGLDSRMSVCVAREKTNAPIDVVTYSQTGYYDEIIPKDISNAWNCKMYFHPLDGGDYLCKVDDVNQITGSIICYAGAAQVLAGFDKILNKGTGVVLTGMIGDIVISCPWEKTGAPYSGLGAISTNFLKYIQTSTQDLTRLFPTQELYYLYVRGFNCADLGSPLILQMTGESYSPFYDVDLLQFCMSIPQEQRYNHRLYDQWILTYHPQAANWPHNGTRQIGQHPIMCHVIGRDIPLKDVPKRLFWYVCKKLHIHNYYEEHADGSMNPMDDWYQYNPTLRKELDDYFATHISFLTSKKLQHAASELYQKGTMMEKVLVLTLLSSEHLFVSQSNCHGG